MQQLTIDGAFASVLGQANGPTELRDGQGKLLGVYQPAIDVKDVELLKFAKERFNFQEAARIAVEQRGQGVTTDMLLERLRARGVEQ